MQDFSGLTKALSVERLARYRINATDTDRVVAARYLWNVALSESLHTCLQFAEVTLRNAIHEEMQGKFSDPFWFEDPSIVKQGTIQAIGEVRRKLEREAHQEGCPNPVFTDGDLVADTSFGFWVAFFYAEYMTVSPKALWSGHSLKRVFPYATNADRAPKDLKKVLERVRRLRNRVSHHEPLWNRNNLVQAHAEVHRVIRWMNPEVEALVSSVDRFQAVFTAGESVFFAAVDAAFPDGQ